MKKISFLFILIFVLLTSINAQTIEKKWGWGAGTGGYYNLETNRIGLLPEAYLSRFLSPSFDIMAHVSIGYFGNRITGEILQESLDMLNPSLKLRYKLFNGYIMPMESKLQPYLYGGVGYMFDNAESGANFNLGAGVKYPLNKTFSLFAETGYIDGLEGTRKNTAGDDVAIKDNFLKLVFGFEISFIKQPGTDKDGVIDNLDKCPDTPKGATVDSKGCPSDTDGDGILDGIDKCPDTPKGAPVDLKGCPLDTDDDGVIDLYDKCPDTPKGIKVDEKGCPSDEDGDGVYDQNDKCPGTPKGVEVDDKGCPLDADGDGVANVDDKCPDTPKGTVVDKDGCPDSDGDGVPDKDDKCPDTPKGTVVNTKGCPEGQALVDLTNSKLVPIYFDTNVSTITAEQHAKIDNLVNILNEHPEYKVNVYGHADPRGDAAYNKALSQRRADAAVKLLKQKGIAHNRIFTKAFGEDLVKDENLSDEELQENRKVASYMFIVIE